MTNDETRARFLQMLPPSVPASLAELQHYTAVLEALAVNALLAVAAWEIADDSEAGGEDAQEAWAGLCEAYERWTSEAERREREGDMEEEKVTLVGPWDHDDTWDFYLNKRFIRGKATGVPRSVAEKIVKERRGYHIVPHVSYEPIKQRGADNG
jgi:hypothetical protein